MTRHLAGPAALLFVLGGTAQAQTGQVIQPEIERREVSAPRIDTEDFEVGGFIGVLSIEDFGSNSVAGLRLAYHLSEDVFFEGVYAQSTVSDTAFRRLGIAVFPREHEDLTYYNLSVGFNFFPGEVFVGRNWAMSSAVYVIGGVGDVNFIDEDKFVFNFGIGVRVLPTDWLGLHIDMRDHLFESDLLGENKLTHNFELHTGLTVFF